MSRKPRISIQDAPGFAHPFPADVVKRLVDEAWHDAFYPAMRSVPHQDNDPLGQARIEAQREHLQLLLGLFTHKLATHAVACGLYPTVDAVLQVSECASDPAPAGVARMEGDA